MVWFFFSVHWDTIFPLNNNNVKNKNQLEKGTYVAAKTKQKKKTEKFKFILLIYKKLSILLLY